MGFYADFYYRILQFEHNPSCIFNFKIHDNSIYIIEQFNSNVLMLFYVEINVIRLAFVMRFY